MNVPPDCTKSSRPSVRDSSRKERRSAAVYSPTIRKKSGRAIWYSVFTRVMRALATSSPELRRS